MSGLTVSDDKAVPVGKTWSELAPGRHFLVESVDYNSIRPALGLLPAAPGADATNPKKKIGRMAELIRERPQRVAALSRDTNHSIQVAQVTPQTRNGVNIDYQFLNTIANQTLKSDTTYYVTNTCILSGLTVIEGGTVVKYTNGAQVTNANGFLGYESSANGTVEIDGAGSMWTNTGNLYVGGSDSEAAGVGASAELPG